MDIRKGSDDQIALEDPVIQRLSKKYGNTPAQVRVDFYAPEIKDRGYIVFVLSIILYFFFWKL